MKLDPRIEWESLIYTPLDNTQVNLHENGYFADYMIEFADLNDCEYGELVDQDIGLSYPYWCKPDYKNEADCYPFYIPESSLKPVDEKIESKE